MKGASVPTAWHPFGVGEGPAASAGGRMSGLGTIGGRRGGELNRAARVAGAARLSTRSSAAQCLCPKCGAAFRPDAASAFQRNGILISQDPVTAHWEGEPLDLSPTEHAIVRLILVRGKASFEEIDEEIAARGGNPANRKIFLWRIRRKLHEAGAPPLLHTQKSYGILMRERTDPRRAGSLLIGMSV